MPILKHAKKKLRQDKKRALKNKKLRGLYKDLIKKAKKNPSAENISVAFKQIDKAAKNHLIHENKAARLKSALSKVTVGSEPEKPKAEAKKASKAVAKKPTRNASQGDAAEPVAKKTAPKKSSAKSPKKSTTK